MSLDIGELIARARVDTSGMARDVSKGKGIIQNASRDWEGEAGKGGERAGKTAGQKMSATFGSSMRNLAAGVAGAFAVSKAVTFLRSTIDAASDLNETVNMSSVIFGKNASVIEQWSNGSARNLGLSKQAALDSAASFGDMFLQLGFAGDSATKMSTATVQMAADLGSFKNLKTEDVVERLSAAFRSEYDSLQALIPNISAARVEQEAMAATGKKNATQLTAQEKAAAVLAIVQKDGARAMGDFARTSDGAANSQKIAAAQTENLKAQIGDKLLPAWIALIKFGNDKVIPFLGQAVDFLGKVAGAVGPVVGGLGDVVGIFSGVPGPVKAAVTALALFLLLRPKLTSFADSFGGKMTSGVKGLSGGLDTLRLRAMYAGDAFRGAGGGVRGFTSVLGTSARAGLRGAASGLLGVLGGPWGIVLAGAAVAVGFWAKKQREAKAAAAESKQNIDELTGTLDANTAAFTRSTRELVVKQLEERGALTASQKYGVSLKEVTDAVMAGGPALAALTEKIRQQNTSVVDSADPMSGLVTSYTVLDEGAGQLIDTLMSQNGQLSESQKAQRRTAEAMKSSTDAAAAQKAQIDKQTAAIGPLNTTTEQFGVITGKATGQQYKALDATRFVTQATKEQSGQSQVLAANSKKLTAQQKTLKGATQTLREKTKALTQAFLDQVGATTDAMTAASDYQAALDDASASVKDNGHTLDINTAKGRTNKENLLRLATAARDQAKANLTNGDAIGKVTKEMSGSRADFITMARNMGMNKTRAGELADQLGLTKGTVKGLSTTIDKVPNKTAKIAVKGVAQAKAAVEAAQRAIDSLKGRSVTVSAQFGVIKGPAAGQQYRARDAMGRRDGGSILGAGTGTSDSIPAMGPGGQPYALSNGEHVWTKAEVDHAGGHDAMKRLRQKVLTSGAAFATGGPIGTFPARLNAGLDSFIARVGPAMMGGLGGPTGMGSSAGGWQAIWRLAQGLGIPGLRMTSNYRPGATTRSGFPSLHGQRRAVDMVSSNMMQLFNTLRAASGWRELYYSPAGGRQILMGRPHNTMGTPAYADHFTHVHAARAKGGPVVSRGYAAGTRGAAPGLAWVGEHEPELVRFGGGEHVRTTAQARTDLAHPAGNDKVAALLERVLGELSARRPVGNITVNGVPMDQANRVATEINYEVKRAQLAGAYGRRG